MNTAGKRGCRSNRGSNETEMCKRLIQINKMCQKSGRVTARLKPVKPCEKKWQQNNNIYAYKKCNMELREIK